MTEYFKEQLDGGTTDNFFYAVETNGSLKIERHRGPLETLSLEKLVFDRMMGATPLFKDKV